LLVSVVIILITLLSVVVIVYTEINKQAREDYFNNSNEQMNLIDSSIRNFYNQIDKDLNMMATNPLVMKSDKSITSYENNL